MAIDYEVRAHSRMTRLYSLSPDPDERATQAYDWWAYAKHCGDDRLASVWRAVYRTARRAARTRLDGSKRSVNDRGV